MKKIVLFILLFVSFLPPTFADRLAEIQKAGVIRVGTTGDYKPFSYMENRDYVGYDIDVAKHFASELGVELKWVKTSWKALLNGLNQNRYDLAVGGITRKMSRQWNAEQTQGYMTFGKCFLVRRGMGEQYNTLEKVNRASVRLGVNIGGTNELFADEKLSKATFTRFEINTDVPEAVANNQVDVMVTETPEALFYQATDRRLEAVHCHNPFTKSQFGYLVPKGEQRLLNMINFMMDEMQHQGKDKVLMKKHQLL